MDKASIAVQCSRTKEIGGGKSEFKNKVCLQYVDGIQSNWFFLYHLEFSVHMYISSALYSLITNL